MILQIVFRGIDTLELEEGRTLLDTLGDQAPPDENRGGERG